MRPLLTPAEAGELDRVTQAAGTPAEMLMERAGAGVARACLDLLGGGYGRRAVVVCGKGNNGGDGLVAARHLSRAGVRVAVLLLRTDFREPSAANLDRLARETDVRVRPFDPAVLGRELARSDLAVDAIFGTGFAGAPEDEWAEAIEIVNAGAPPVVAVDIASGVDGATGEVGGVAIRADLTVTFGAAKLGSVLLPGAEFAGDVRVLDIGFDDAAMPMTAGLTDPADVAAVLPERPIDGHKKASGTLLVVAGSRGMPGAARLAARAAERAGAGLRDRGHARLGDAHDPGRPGRGGVPAAARDGVRLDRGRGDRRGDRGGCGRARGGDRTGADARGGDDGVRAGAGARGIGAGRRGRRRAQRVRRRAHGACRPQGRGGADPAPRRAGAPAGSPRGRSPLRGPGARRSRSMPWHC